MVMREFRKKPVIVQAVQIKMSQEFYDFLEDQLHNEDDELLVLDSIGDEIWPQDDPEEWPWDDAVCIQLNTENTFLQFKEGDWLVKGVDGSIYPVKDETFHKVYEAVDSKAVITW